MLSKKHIFSLLFILIIFFAGFAFFSGKLNNVTGFAVESTRNLVDNINLNLKDYPPAEAPPLDEPEKQETIPEEQTNQEENTRELPVENNEPLIDNNPTQEEPEENKTAENPISNITTQEQRKIAGGSSPIIEEIFVNSSPIGSNYVNENLTCWANATDSEGDNISYEGEWYKNGDIFVGELWNATFNSGFEESGGGWGLTTIYDWNFTPYDLDVDSSGNAILAGVLDMDDAFGGDTDFQLIKYNSLGEYQWNATKSKSTNDVAMGVVTDSSGDIFLTGTYFAITQYNTYTAKYNSDGTFLWETIDSAGSRFNDIALSNSENNLYVTGRNDNNDYYTIKYNSTGGHVWNVTYDGGGTGIAYGVGLDSFENVYVTGRVYNGADSDYYTIKYNSSGDHQWNTTYDGGDADEAHGIAVSDLGNIYVTGWSNLGGNYDYYTIKYNSSGDHQWNITYDGGDVDEADKIDVDSWENVYVTGWSNLGGNYDYYTIKYNSSGDHQWNITYDGGDADEAHGIDVDSFGNVYVTGEFDNGTEINAHTIKYKNGFNLINQTQGILVNVSELNSQFTSVGDNWGCKARAYDGASYSSDYNFSENITIAALPSCGSTITQDTILIENLSCSGTHGITIGADNVVLDCAGFAILGDGTTNKYGVSMYDHQNITVKNCYVDYFYHNVHNLRSNNTQILNNTLLRAVHYGIAIQGPSDNHTLSDNEIAYSEMHGILFAAGLLPNTNVIIKNNNIHDNLYYHIITNAVTITDSNTTIFNNTLSNSHLTGGGYGVYGYYTPDINVSHNTISNNSYGIKLFSSGTYNSENYTIYNNEITNSTYYGIDIEKYSDGTLIYNNIIKDNSNNVRSKATDVAWNTTYDCSQNSILGGSCIGGNYYDDYTGRDTTGDGIGDTQYNISGSGNNIDYLPLTYLNNAPVIRQLFINSTYNGNYTHENLFCWANATDEDGDVLNYTGYWINDNEILVNESWNDLYDGGGSWDIISSVETDSLGNIYVTGYSDHFGTFDILTIKYNSSGSRIANATYDSNGASDEVKSLAIDSQDNIIVGGFTGDDGNNFLIVKYNSSLDYLWDTQISSNGVDPVTGVITDSQDNIYFVADTDDGYGDTLYKLNSSGDYQWNVSFDFTGVEDPYGKVAVDSDDNIYVSGIIYPPGGPYSYDTYLVKYDSSGNYQWNLTYDSGESDAVYDSAIDFLDNIYLTGYTNVSGERNFLLIKYNSSGNYQWNTTYDMPGTAYEGSGGIDIDHYNEIYIAGENYGVATDFVKFNSSGNQIWNKTYLGASFGEDIAVDSLGGIYVAGWPYNLRGSGNWDYFLVKFNGMFVLKNQTQGILANVSTLDNSYTSDGEDWTCKARAYDGINFSLYNFSSNNISISTNSPPTTNISIFNDSSTLRTLLFSSLGSDISTAFRINKNVNITSAILKLLGYSYSGSYPSNITIDIGNDNIDDWFYNGTLDSLTGENGSYSNSFFEVGDLPDSEISSLESFNNSLYAGTSLGDIYKSSNNGETWTIVKDTSESNIFDFANLSNILYAGTGHNGKIYKSSNNGETWSIIYTSAESQIRSFVLFNNVLYAGTGNNGKILKSSDGTTWQEVYDSDSTIIYSMVDYNDKIYATGNGKIYSSSDGSSWTKEWDDSLFGYYFSSQEKNISHETFSFYEYDNTLYLATGSNGYILETNGSGKWYITEHLDSINLTSLGTLKQELYAGDNQGKVFKQLFSNSELSNYSSEYAADDNTVLLCHFQNSLTCEQGETPNTSENISYATGKFNQGVLLNNSVLWYNLSENLNLSQGTIEFWIKPLFDWNDNEERMFFDAGNESMFFRIKKSANNSNLYKGNNTIYFGIENSSGDGFHSNYPIDADLFEKEQWHHVLATWNNSGLSLFLDGKKTNTIKIDRGSIFQEGNIISIGNNLNYTTDSLVQSTQPVNAVIDELRILNVTTNLNNSWENTFLIHNEIHSFEIFNDSLYAGTGNNGKIYKSGFFKNSLNELINNCSCIGCYLEGLNCHISMNISSDSAGNLTLANLTMEQEVADIVWGKNNNYTLIDLDSFFYDADGHTLSFNITGNSSIDYEINASNVLILSPSSGWTGTEYLVITADDGYGGNTSSNNFTLQVINANDYAPTLVKGIPDVSWPKDTSYTGLDLDSYFSDADGNDLSFTSSGVDNIAVTIDSETNIVTFTPASDFTGTGSVTFTADDGVHTTDSNSVLLTVYSPTAPPSSPSGGGSSSGKNTRSFSLVPDLINEQIFKGETVSKKILIKNTGGITLDVLLKPSKTIENLVTLSENQFNIYPKNEKEFTVVVTIPGYFSPDVYTGQIIADLIGSSPFGESKYVKKLDLVLDVRQRQALFDIKLDLLKQRISPGKEISANISLFNIGTLKDIDVVLRYGVKNMNNEVIKEISESLSVNEQKTITRNLKTPDYLNSGKYVFYGNIEYSNTSAVASEVFYIEQRERNIMALIISILSILILTTGIFTVYSKREWIKDKYKMLTGKKEVKKDLKITAGQETINKLESLRTGLNEKNKAIKYKEFMRIMRAYFVIRFAFIPTITFTQLKGKFLNKKIIGSKHLNINYFNKINSLAYTGEVINLNEFKEIIGLSILIVNELQEDYIQKIENISQEQPAINISNNLQKPKKSPIKQTIKKAPPHLMQPNPLKKTLKKKYSSRVEFVNHLIPEAKRFVINVRKKGYNNEQIRYMFRKNGWRDEEIDKILK